MKHPRIPINPLSVLVDAQQRRLHECPVIQGQPYGLVHAYAITTHAANRIASSPLHFIHGTDICAQSVVVIPQSSVADYRQRWQILDDA